MANVQTAVSDAQPISHVDFDQGKDPGLRAALQRAKAAELFEPDLIETAEFIDTSPEYAEKTAQTYIAAVREEIEQLESQKDAAERFHAEQLKGFDRDISQLRVSEKRWISIGTIPQT